jgi:hypothetical protein
MVFLLRISLFDVNTHFTIFPKSIDNSYYAFAFGYENTCGSLKILKLKTFESIRPAGKPICPQKFTAPRTGLTFFRANKVIGAENNLLSIYDFSYSM